MDFSFTEEQETVRDLAARIRAGHGAGSGARLTAASPGPPS